MLQESMVLPPGPPGRRRPTLKLIKNPRQAFAEWVAAYGDPFLLNALNGPVVVTGRADLIREIFSNDPDAYGLFATGTVLPLLGPGSLLMMEGEPHRRERKLLSPMFHGERMRAYGATMQDVTLRQLESVRDRPRFWGLDVAQAISLEIIARAIFGGRDAETLREMMEGARQLARHSSPLIFFSRRMQFRLMGLSPWDRFLKARERLYAALGREIAAARSAPGDRQDILSLLAHSRYDDGTGPDDESLKNELGTLLFAGHETSALAVAWALYHVHRHADVLEKLRASLDAGDGTPEVLVRNEYLKAVVQETLRLNPIVTEVLRLLKVPMQLDRFRIPAGMAVAPASAIAHYDPQTYPDPDQFRPERFLERSFSPSEFLPFGGGHRRCIGAAFATFELAVVLGTLLHRFEFELLEKRPVECRRRNVTMGPATGIALRVRGNRS